MSPADAQEIWASGEAYDLYVGRWSRMAAKGFLEWVAIAPGARWLDVGCGTGALSGAIVALTSPQSLKGIDQSEEHVVYARRQVVDLRVAFEVGDAQDLTVESGTFDVAVSGLVLNFVPEPLRMVAEMARAVRPDGSVALYVWDYAGKMEMMRYFWDAATALDPSAHALDEDERFPICKPEPLATLLRDAGLTAVQTGALEIRTDFGDFDDYWLPFLGGQGPAPGYAMSLTGAGRVALRERLRATLPVQPDGSIHLAARAWTVRGQRASTCELPRTGVMATIDRQQASKSARWVAQAQE